MNDKSKEYTALNTINAGDYGITMFIDTSTPLIIEVQLFWFDERITKFLEATPDGTFVCSNGVRIGIADEFKYTPAEMESEEAYLTGFGSNTQQGCYDKLIINVGNDDEKVGVCTELTVAISDMIRAASNLQPGNSPVVRWTL
jgi:hypothetical protein